METHAKTLATKAWTIVCAAALMGSLVYAAQAPPKNDDLVPALLLEVRGLRAAMEQMASAGPRVQLFVGRLQLQEGRMNGMMRRLDAVRDSLASARQEYDNARESLRTMERDIVASSPQIPKAELEAVLNERKRAVTVTKASVDRYAAEETQLAADLATEQGRWIDINQRLDDLERALSKR